MSEHTPGELLSLIAAYVNTPHASRLEFIRAHPLLRAPDTQAKFRSLIPLEHDPKRVAQLISVLALVDRVDRFGFDVGAKALEDAESQIHMFHGYFEQLKGVQSDHAKVIEILLDALRRCDLELHDPTKWAHAKAFLADEFARLQQPGKAELLEALLTHAEDALRCFTENAYASEHSRIRLNMGNALFTYYLSTGNVFLHSIGHVVELAEMHTKEALRISTDCNNASTSAQAHRNLATIYFVKRDLASGIHHCKEALVLLDPNLEPTDWASCHIDIATAACDSQGDEKAAAMEVAISHCGSALEVLSDLAPSRLWALTNSLAGRCYSERVFGTPEANIRRSIKYLKEAISAYESVNHAEGAQAKYNLGIAYGRNPGGDWQENRRRAIECFDAVMPIFTASGDAKMRSLTHHGLGLAKLRDYLAISPLDVAGGAEHIRSALTIRFPNDGYYQMRGRINLAAAALNGVAVDRHRIALRHLRLAIAAGRTSPRLLREAEAAAGHVYLEMKRWNTARVFLSSSIRRGEAALDVNFSEEGRLAQFEQLSRLYADRSLCHLNLGRYLEALQDAEEAKARLLREVLARGNLLVEQATGAKETYERVFLIEAELRSMSDTHSDRRTELLSDLQRSKGELAAPMHDTEVASIGTAPTVEEIEASVPDGGALVSIVARQMGGFAIVLTGRASVITEDNVVWLPTLTSESVGKALVHLHPGLDITRSDPRSLDSMAQWLWDIALGSIRDRLRRLGVQDGSHIVFTTLGVLSTLPLHAAADRLSGSKEYFAQCYVVSYSPSIFAYTESTRRWKARVTEVDSVLVVADPSDNLPFSYVEGRVISRMFADKTTLVGSNATIDAVVENAKGRTLVHLACHGNVSPMAGFESSLMLAGGKPFSAAALAASLDLRRSKLVTLSACNTGLPSFAKAPEEYLGLPTACFIAGAATVLSSLWPVNDLSTMLLMRRFLQNLVNKQPGSGATARGISPSYALAEAQEWLRTLDVAEVKRLLAVLQQEAQLAGEFPDERLVDAIDDWSDWMSQVDSNAWCFSDPYFWAPFQLIGY